MKKKLLLLLDLFFLTRPVVIAPVWGFAAFGMYRAAGGELFLFPALSSYILILLYSLSVGAVYVINQIADIEVDKDNGGLPLLVKGEIPLWAAYATAAVCAAASIIGPLLMGHNAIAALSAVAIIAGCIYSCKPFSLSGRPFFDFLTNAFEALLAFIAGWFATIPMNLLPSLNVDYPLFIHMLLFLCIEGLPYFLLMCAGSIGSTLPDIPGDRAHGKITTAVHLGERGANIIALCALIAVIPASFLSSLIVQDIASHRLAISCAALSIPFYIIYMIRPTPTTMEMTYKVGGALTMIAASLALPLIFPAGIFIFIITWIYFKKRHGVSYPSLTPDDAR